jgi:hypothetical protein
LKIVHIVFYKKFGFPKKFQSFVQIFFLKNKSIKKEPRTKNTSMLNWASPLQPTLQVAHPGRAAEGGIRAAIFTCLVAALVFY